MNRNLLVLIIVIITTVIGMEIGSYIAPSDLLAYPFIGSLGGLGFGTLFCDWYFSNIVDESD